MIHEHRIFSKSIKPNVPKIGRFLVDHVPFAGRTAVHAKGRVMEKGYVYYFLFEHSPPSSQSGIFLYKLDTDDIAVDRLPQPELTADGQPLEPIFRFPHGKYPRGMGCGVLEGKLFMFGGCFPQGSEATPEFSDKLYILDPTDIGPETTEESVERLLEIRHSTHVKKCDPIVVVADKKFYVFPRNFGSEYGMFPSIQSYDPCRDEWNSYDIFKQLKDDKVFRSLPSTNYSLDVIAYCVRDCEIVLLLPAGSYFFDLKTETLKRMRKAVCNRYPFFGMGALVDGCLLGCNRDCVFCYMDFPFGAPGKPPFHAGPYMFDHCPRDLRGSASLVINLPDVAENKSVLVVNSGSRLTVGLELDKEFTMCMSLDFLCAAKDAQGYLVCNRKDSVEYHLSKDNYDSRGRVIACLPIRKKLDSNELTTSLDPHTSDALPKEPVGHEDSSKKRRKNRVSTQLTNSPASHDALFSLPEGPTKQQGPIKKRKKYPLSDQSIACPADLSDQSDGGTSDFLMEEPVRQDPIQKVKRLVFLPTRLRSIQTIITVGAKKKL